MTNINGNNISQELRTKLVEAFEQATVSRGRNKGKLKAKCPKINTLGSAAWQGLQTNPFKVGYGHILMMDSEHREVYEWFDELRKRTEEVINK